MLKEIVQAQTCGLVRINNQDLQIKELNRQRVLTFKDIDKLHERVEGTAGRNFRENKIRFIEKLDYFEITPKNFQLDEIRFFGIDSPRGGILITESGYLMLTKSLQDDLAWEVQRELVNNYFRVTEQKPNCIEDILIASLKEMKEVKYKIQEVEAKQIETKEEIQGIRDVVALNPNQWRKDTSDLINKISSKLGGFEHIKPIREESYKMLNEEMGVSLSARLLNKKKKMALEGVSKSKMDKVNNLDVIADDKKLISGYVSIIKKLAIKYGVA